jgi:hypothetical protein
MELKDWLYSINVSKEHLIKEDPSLEKEYPPYVINKCLSGQLDSVLFANEMNMNHQLDNRLQYDFFINSLRKRKRFSPWLRKESVKDLEAIKEYYKFSSEKAEQALKLLTPEQIAHIHKKLYRGGPP